MAAWFAKGHYTALVVDTCDICCYAEGSDPGLFEPWEDINSRGKRTMVLTDLRQELEAARAEAAQASNVGVVEKLDRILAELQDDLLLTTTEAASLLGIGSVNTIKAMIHAGQIHARKVGTHHRIPLSEVERLRQDTTIRGLQASSRVHAEIATLGSPEGLTDQELEDLEEARPGTLPWERSVTERL